MEKIECSYGCGQEAKYKLKNGKLCCNKSQNSCIAIKEKFSKSSKGKKKLPFSKEHREKIGFRTKGKKFEEIYGKEKGEKLRQNRREVMINGQASYLCSIPRDPEKIKKAAKIQSEKIKGEGNPNRLLEVREKKRQHMLNGGAVKANSGIKNPSKPQMELYNRIKEIYSTAILNYPCYPLNYSLDIFIPELKIFFESDGSYWHQNKQKDLERQKKIENLGMKCIRYIINNVKDVPSKEKIKEDIGYFINGKN